MPKSNNILIITGSSKGIGKAVLDHFSQRGYYCFSIARSTPENLKFNGKHFNISLLDTNALSSVFNEIQEEEIVQNASKIVLINNAGTLGDVAALKDIPIENIQDTIQLNLTATLQSNSLFLRSFYDSKQELCILNISSGAANKAFFGWTVYSASKAGIDAMTKSIAKETANHLPKCSVYSVYPGVVDTQMQAQIREQHISDFPEVNRFKDLKKEGNLASPESVARKILFIAENPSFKNGSVIDIRNISA